MITFAELMTELQKLGKEKSQSDFRKQQRDRKRKDPGGQKKKIQNKKYRLSAKGKKNAAITKRLDDRNVAKTATGRDKMTRNVSGMGGRERLKQKKQAPSQG